MKFLLRKSQLSIFDKFENFAMSSYWNNLSLAKIQAWFFPIILFLIGLSNLIVIYIGGREFINGNIEIGVIAEFIIYVNMLTWPVTLVGWVTSIVKQAEASQKRINEFLDSRSSLEDGHLSIKDRNSKNIVFKNVTFTYQRTGIRVFDSFNLEIEEGKTLGIIGLGKIGKRLVEITSGFNIELLACDLYRDEDFAKKLVDWADIIRKTYYEGAIDDVITTRRLVHIVNAYRMFGDKLKSITMCISRFDEDTRNAVLDLYTKVDEGVHLETEKPLEENDDSEYNEYDE